MKKIIIFALSFFMFLHISVAASAKDATETQLSDTIFVTDQLKLVPKFIHEEDHKLHYKIDVSYPTLNGDNLTPTAIQFNEAMTDIVSKEIARFKKYVLADIPHLQNLPEDLKHNTLSIDYDTDVIKPSDTPLISVRITVEGMQAGRAHPYHSNITINYDLASGKTISLDSLFKPNSKYLHVLSAYCKKKLEEKLSDKWMIAEGTKPLEKNFKLWNIESDSLIITFDEYQVAPYVDGVQEVEIPYSELKDIIAPTAPIATCVTDPKSCTAQLIPTIPEETSTTQV